MSEQKSVKTLARLMGEMMATEGWKEYIKIIEEQIKTRELILLTPSHELPQQVGFDYVARAASQECIKGALIGLKLARDMPSAIIADAKDSATPQPKEEK